MYEAVFYQYYSLIRKLIDTVSWLPADEQVVTALKQRLLARERRNF